MDVRGLQATRRDLMLCRVWALSCQVLSAVIAWPQSSRPAFWEGLVPLLDSVARPDAVCSAAGSCSAPLRSALSTPGLRLVVGLSASRAQLAPGSSLPKHASTSSQTVYLGNCGRPCCLCAVAAAAGWAGGSDSTDLECWLPMPCHLSTALSPALSSAPSVLSCARRLQRRASVRCR